MRIRELLEGKEFNDIDFVRKDGEEQSLDFDLAEDLIHYLNNDDQLYRRLVYPVVHKCVEGIKAHKKVNPSIFKHVALEAYKSYVRKFPIRLLPDDLEEDVCNEVCKKMHEDLCKNVEEGKYKD